MDDPRELLRQAFASYGPEWAEAIEAGVDVSLLVEQLPSHGWAIEHDVRIGARGANIDHLLIGPPGDATRESLWVQGLLVFVKPGLTVKQQPRYVSVLTDETLLPYLRERPVKLGKDEVEVLIRAVRRESTWQ